MGRDGGLSVNILWSERRGTKTTATTMTRTTTRRHSLLLLSLPSLATVLPAVAPIEAWTIIPPSLAPVAPVARRRMNDDRVGPRATTTLMMMRRRDLLTSSLVGTIVVGTSSASSPSWAASLSGGSQDDKDKENIVRGYKRLQYLLDNWEKETTVCKIGQEVGFGIDSSLFQFHYIVFTCMVLLDDASLICRKNPMNALRYFNTCTNAYLCIFILFIPRNILTKTYYTNKYVIQTTFGDKCERTPTKVMEYLGFKSTSDPLFKAESTMMRLKAYVPIDRESDYYDAIDAFTLNAEEANSMAFVSSWGEANPGGGKDRVRLFIERSRNNVVKSRDSLRTVMDILDLVP